MDIKKKIREHGYTLEEIAKKLKSNRSGELGISQPSMSSIVNGNTTVARLQEIADVLGITLSELVADDTGNPSGEKEELSVRCPKCGSVIRLKVDD